MPFDQLPRGCPSEVSQIGKNKYHMILLVCEIGESKKMVEMNLFVKQKQNSRCRKETIVHKGEVTERIN